MNMVIFYGYDLQYSSHCQKSDLHEITNKYA